jgi:hypothetical protein
VESNSDGGAQQLEGWPVSKQNRYITGIENFVRGAHKRDEYEMPNNFMTDFRGILVY